MGMLYHGSIAPGITTLEARSTLHGTEQKGVYLTDSIPYALFYIWDAEHNEYRGKYVTGGFRNGTAFYEEQFPDQMMTFYQGVSGYLYHIPFTEAARPVRNRDGLFFLPGCTEIAGVELIPDVYAALLKYEAAGQLKVLRFRQQSLERQKELTDMIAAAILHSNFFEGDEDQRRFMQTHFEASWRIANEH